MGGSLRETRTAFAYDLRNAGHPWWAYRLAPPQFLRDFSMLGADGVGGRGLSCDLRLGRSVAIKVLLPVVTSDPDRLARVEREARAVALVGSSEPCWKPDAPR